MRTTIDLPDTLFRRTKAKAAVRGTSLKQVIIEAVERDLDSVAAPQTTKHRTKLPVVHAEAGRTLDLTNFDFDDLLA